MLYQSALVVTYRILWLTLGFEPGFSIDRDEDYTCEVNDEYAGPQAAQQLIDEKVFYYH